MARIRYITMRGLTGEDVGRYLVLFADGSSGCCSQRAVEDLFPDRDWDIVKEKTSQWFYV